MNNQVVLSLENLVRAFHTKASSLAPNLFTSLIVIIVGIAIAFLFRFVVVRILTGTNRFLAKRGLSNRFVKEGTEPASRLLGSVIFWMVILFSLTLVAEIVGFKIVTDWLGGLTNYLPKIFASVFVAFLGFIVGGLLKDLISNAASTAGLVYSATLGKTVYLSVLLVTSLVILKQLGIEVQILVNSVLLILGAFLFGGTLSFALGARTIVSDILCSYFLQKNYQVGDTVQIGDEEGQIIKISSTFVILDSKGTKVAIPAKLFSKQISKSLRAGDQQ